MNPLATFLLVFDAILIMALGCAMLKPAWDASEQFGELPSELWPDCPEDIRRSARIGLALMATGALVLAGVGVSS